MFKSRSLVAIAVAGWLTMWSTAASAQTDAEQERDEVQERQAQVEGELDVLQASDAEIDAVLDDIERQLSTQQAAVDEARAAADAAEQAVTDAKQELRLARHDVVVLRDAIAEMAIASFVHPPTVDLVEALGADSLSDALLQKAFLDARARRDLRLLDLLEIAEQEAEDRAAELATASEAAATAVTEAEAALAGLEAERARQSQFAADLRDRIDSRLAEAAVLADMDAELSDQIAAEQAELLSRIPPPPPPEEVVPQATPSPTTTTPQGGSGPTTTRPPTTTPPPPPSQPGTPPLRTVQGITVHADIASDVDALLNAARADGISLSGWGYRSSDSQIALRRAHCGPTQYDIWQKPAGACSPPTARPGTSLHEQGRAIDFTYNGSTITSRSSPAFQWLAAHASSYGLFNLPSEPWHWSTSGG